MSIGTQYAKLGYLMLKKETNEADAVYPDTAIELLSESIKTVWSHTNTNTIAGNRSVNQKPVKGRVEPATGSIEIWVEPKTLGHFLTGVFGEATDTTLEASTVWQHDFEPLTTLEPYTMDIKLADENYVTRYFGVTIESVEFTTDENKAKLIINVQAQKTFSNARVLTDVAAGTSLSVDQTSGITTSDTIIVLDKDDPSTEIAEYTITAVVSETVLTVSTIGDSLEEDDIVVIKKQTPSYDLSNELIWSGGAQVYAANGANGIQNLAAFGNVEDLTITITNEIEQRWAAGVNVIDRMPSETLIKGISVEGSWTQYYRDPEFLDILREMEQNTLRFEWLGVVLASNAAAAASATVETDGTDTIDVTIDATGEAGNDYAIIVELGTTTLSAALSGKLITVTLSATPAQNTTTLVAAAIDGLTGISSSSTGTDLVDVASNPDKIDFGSGRDANEVEKLRIDLPDVRLQPFNVNLGTDDVLNEEISFTAFQDANDDRPIKIRLRNAVDDY